VVRAPNFCSAPAGQPRSRLRSSSRYHRRIGVKVPRQVERAFLRALPDLLPQGRLPRRSPGHERRLRPRRRGRLLGAARHGRASGRHSPVAQRGDGLSRGWANRPPSPILCCAGVSACRSTRPALQPARSVGPSPQGKGRDERTVGYMETSFLALRRFASLADLQAQHYTWRARLPSDVMRSRLPQRRHQPEHLTAAPLPTGTSTWCASCPAGRSRPTNNWCADSSWPPLAPGPAAASGSSS
jgi:hypothetical protein